MQENPYVITRAEGRWTIRFRGRLFDRFEDKDDAVLTALIRAETARRQGKRVKVLVEENGCVRTLWGETPGSSSSLTESEGSRSRPA